VEWSDGVSPELPPERSIEELKNHYDRHTKYCLACQKVWPQALFAGQLHSSMLLSPHHIITLSLSMQHPTCPGMGHEEPDPAAHCILPLPKASEVGL
jgi:hypothetical protein